MRISLITNYQIYIFSRLLRPMLNSISISKSIQLSLNLQAKKKWLNLTKHILYLNSLCQFEMLSELTIVERNVQKGRLFQLVCILTSHLYCSRVWLSIEFYKSLILDTFSDVFINSIWSERECTEMFNIVYWTGLRDTRRLLTDYGFIGYPLRKDFPLTGYKEIRYDDTVASIVIEPVELSQDFRFFINKNVWEGR